MPDDIISKIKDRLDVVDLISSYLKLQKSGVNYKARCPFHSEKSASFFVSPERQIWHCFGCSRGGDIFGFIKEIEGMDFPEALRLLAARAGVEIEKFAGPEFKKFQNQKTKLLEITELAARFFEKQLKQSNGGKKVLAYLGERGLTDESIKNFRLGYAHDSWDALYNFLSEKYEPKDIAEAGLLIKKDSGGYYDRFRSRIIFPVTDINSQVVGFSGRIFGASSEAGQEPAKTAAEAAKYINTPQTPIYDKSAILYGMDKARQNIRQRDRCLVVEGNMDVIMSHQSGVNNAVALSGTALTSGHLKMIKRYTNNLDLCFDADAAGSLATDRGIVLALANNFNVGVLAIDEEGIKDPADFVKKYGSKWSEYSSKSKPFIRVLIDNGKKKFDLTTALGKKMLTEKILPFVASLASGVERAHWLEELASTVKVKEEILSQEIAKVQPATSSVSYETASVDIQPDTDKTFSDKNRLTILEEGLLSLVIKKPLLREKITADSGGFLSDKLRETLQKAEYFKASDKPVDFTMPLFMEFAYLRAQELWNDFEDKELEFQFDNILGQIKKRKLLVKLEELEYDIKTAERNNDKNLLAGLVAEFSKLSSQLNG